MTLRAVTLYRKPGCHLCEDAEAVLHHLARRYPMALALVDVSADPALLERYGLRIPVVDVAGREYDAPLEPRTLERALAEAAR